MTQERNVVVAILIASIVVGVIFDFIFYLFFSSFLDGYPGYYTTEYDSPFMATGVAAAFFTISMLLYPVFTKGVKEFGREDFR